MLSRQFSHTLGVLSLFAWVVSDYVCCPHLTINSTPFTLKSVPVWKKYTQVWIINNTATALMSIAIWLSEPNHPSTNDKSSSGLFIGTTGPDVRATAACRQPRALSLPLLCWLSSPFPSPCCLFDIFSSTQHFRIDLRISWQKCAKIPVSNLISSPYID